MQRVDYPVVSFDNIDGRRLGRVWGYLQGRKAHAVFIPETDTETMLIVNTEAGEVEPDPRIEQIVIDEFHRVWKKHIREWEGE